VLRIPRVIQYNKRDLPAALPIERMRAALNPDGAPEFEAVARDGRGVTETLRTACKAVLARLSQPSAPPVNATPTARAMPPVASPTRVATPTRVPYTASRPVTSPSPKL
jgi:hypothetical protein